MGKRKIDFFGKDILDTLNKIVGRGVSSKEACPSHEDKKTTKSKIRPNLEGSNKRRKKETAEKCIHIDDSDSEMHASA